VWRSTTISRSGSACGRSTGSWSRRCYGPPQYGGGGALDPKDKSRFYFQRDGVQDRLEKGTNRLINVFYRAGSNDWATPKGHASDGAPEQAIYANGRQYLSNSFNSNPTNGIVICLHLGAARRHRGAGRGRQDRPVPGNC